MNHGIQIQSVTLVEWSKVVPQFSDYSIYQTAAYGVVSAEDTGSRLDRVIVRKDGVVIGAAQVRTKKLPILNTGLAYVYFGPLCRPRGLDDHFEQVMDALREEFVSRRGLHLRVAPNRWSVEGESSGSKPLPGWKDVESSQSQTIVVDLSPDIGALRANLSQKWRNGLSNAEKRSVRLERRYDDGAMVEFGQLYGQMWQRKKFETGVAVSSFQRLQQLLATGEKLSVYLAYSEGVLAAGHVSSMLGDSCIYLLGASNEAGRACKASYALQWQALIAAREAGMRWYDLGGIDSVANPGVSHFKAGLGGIPVCFHNPLEASARGFGGVLVPLAERVYRVFRKPRKVNLINQSSAPGS